MASLKDSWCVQKHCWVMWDHIQAGRSSLGKWTGKGQMLEIFQEGSPTRIFGCCHASPSMWSCSVCERWQDLGLQRWVCDEPSLFRLLNLQNVLCYCLRRDAIRSTRTAQRNVVSWFNHIKHIWDHDIVSILTFTELGGQPGPIMAEREDGRDFLCSHRESLAEMYLTSLPWIEAQMDGCIICSLEDQQMGAKWKPAAQWEPAGTITCTPTHTPTHTHACTHTHTHSWMFEEKPHTCTLVNTSYYYDYHDLMSFCRSVFLFIMFSFCHLFSKCSVLNMMVQQARMLWTSAGVLFLYMTPA